MGNFPVWDSIFPILVCAGLPAGELEEWNGTVFCPGGYIPYGLRHEILTIHRIGWAHGSPRRELLMPQTHNVQIAQLAS